MMNDVFARHLESRIADIGDDFQMPPSRTFRMVVNAEFVSAEGFDYDNLFIHYFVELPVGWSATTDSQLNGMTHKSRTTADPRTKRDVAYYCHTFNVDLFFDINRFDLDQEALPKWPQIFFEVVSMDSWSR